MAELIDRRVLRRLRSAESILDAGCGDGRFTTRTIATGRIVMSERHLAER